MKTLFFALIFIGITIGLITLLRSIILWYFKIDELIKILKEIEKNTKSKVV